MMNINKIIKTIFVFLIISLFIYSPDVNALDNRYGIYCAYGDYYFIFSGSHREQFFNLDTNFDELGIAIEADRPGNAFNNSAEQDWFRSKGIIDSNGNFVCPTNPFGSNLGSSTASECGEEGCHVVDIATNYERYTCSYRSVTSGNNLIISYVLDENNSQGRWDVSYPDGSSRTFIGNQINGNFMPGSDCKDIYYTPADKKINVAVYSNQGVSSNVTLDRLCRSYEDNEIEHFCSGSCNYGSVNCPENTTSGSGACPSELRPIFVLIKKLVINTLQIFVPILLIVMGTIDFFKAVMAMDDKGNKEAISKFIKRCISAVAVFFVVTIVTIIMDMFTSTDIGEQSDWKSCWHNID